MGRKQALTYIAVCVGVYLAIALGYLLLINGLLDIFSTSYFFHLIAFLIMAFVFDPILTYFVVEMLPFRAEDLKVPDGLESDLRKEVEVIKNVQ